MTQDVLLNLADAQQGIQELYDDVRAGNLNPAAVFSHFSDLTGSVGGERSQNTTMGALVGGIAGIPAGPVGIWAGVVAGSSIGFWTTAADKRGLLGFEVSEVPAEAEVVEVTHPAIADVDPVQLVVQSTTEDGESDWVRETLTRSHDMDAVEDALSALPEYEADDMPPGGYYIRTRDTDHVVVLVFGEPDADFEL